MRLLTQEELVIVSSITCMLGAHGWTGTQILGMIGMISSDTALPMTAVALAPMGIGGIGLSLAVFLWVIDAN